MKEGKCGKNKKESGVCFLLMDFRSFIDKMVSMLKNVKPNLGRSRFCIVERTTRACLRLFHAQNFH